MTETILGILLKGTEIFTDERRRYFSKKLHDLKNDLDHEKAATYPHYNDARIATAQKKLDNFTEAYAKEFSTSISDMIAKVGSNA